MNASNIENATEIDYLITNKNSEKITAEWIVKKYGERNKDRGVLSRSKRMVRIIRIPIKK